jgi:hypothetical protein
VRACIDELLADVLDGKIEPGRVFDRTVSPGARATTLELLPVAAVEEAR